jgi:hypothetical protein
MYLYNKCKYLYHPLQLIYIIFYKYLYYPLLIVDVLIAFKEDDPAAVPEDLNQFG